MVTSRRTVSVVIATYNGARHIEEQLASVLRQTRPPAEIIVSDDRSSDGTLAIAERMATSAPCRVRIVVNDRQLGFRENFLHAAGLATGDFIAFCDQDDVWRPEKLAVCARWFDRDDVAVIAHAATTIDDASNEIGSFRQGIERTQVRGPLAYDPWSTYWGFSLVFRRELLSLYDARRRFIDYIVPDELIAHDRWITFLGQMVGATAEIAEALVGYRQHGGNLFGAQDRRGRKVDVRARSKDYIRATRQMIAIVQNLSPEALRAFAQFDEARSVAFLRRALDQLEARDAIYSARSKSGSVAAILSCARRGHYLGVHDSRFRWKSLLRDVAYAGS